jgi:hypothetical protein
MMKIGPIQSIDAGGVFGIGFNIHDESGRPVLSLVYETKEKADVAEKHVRAAIEEAISVKQTGSQ